MPDNKKLPSYFKEYLDERFDHVIHKINDVNEKVTRMDKHLDKMNGDMVGVKKESIKNSLMREQKIEEIKELKKMTKVNTRTIRLMIFAFVVGSFVWIKESRDFVISVLLQAVGGG